MAEQLAESLSRVRVYLLSRLDENVVQRLGFAYIEDPREIANLCRRHRNCIVLSNAQRVWPTYRERRITRIMNSLTRDQIQQEFERLRGAVGYVVLQRTTIRLTGQDQKAFLHNLCTNDILKLTPGNGCEAFLCNVQGKILGHIFVTCCEDSLMLDAEAGHAEAIVSQLDKYLITEDVQINDVSSSKSTLALLGEVDAFLSRLDAA